MVYAELHGSTHVLRRDYDLGLEVGLLDAVDVRGIGQILRARDLTHAAVCEVDVVVHRGGGRDEIEAKLALEPLLDDLHMEESQKARTKAKAKRHRGLGRPDERGIVHAELLQGVTKVLVLFVVNGKETRVDHGFSILVARAGLRTGTLLVGDGVARLDEGRVLEARHHKADLTHAELLEGHLKGALAAHTITEEGVTERHQPEPVPLPDATVKDAHRRDDAPVLIEVRVEDEGPQRCLGIALGGRDEVDDGLQEVVDALTGLARDEHRVICRDRKLLLYLFLDLVGMGRGQVDLVDGRHNVQVSTHREGSVRDGLRLDPLGGVHHEHGTLAGGKRARDLIREVNVSRRVDEVELVALAIVGVVAYAHGVRLDGDAALPLDVHGVEHLGGEVPLLHRMGKLEDTVRDRGLAVVDVGDDREVTDM